LIHDVIELYYGRMALQILFEDNHLISINKENSEIVQGDKTGDIPLVEKVKNYIKKKDSKPGNVFLGIPHRLDRPTSGIVVFAKTSKALSRMNELFREKRIEKKYWAIVDSLPESREKKIIHYLVRDRTRNKSMAYDHPVNGGREAVLSYNVIGASDNYFFLEIFLYTGRHHQIRSQLARIGSHIKGDLKYGARRSNKGGGIYLHARELSFTHPVKKTKLLITAPPPEDILWKAFTGCMSK